LLRRVIALFLLAAALSTAPAAGGGVRVWGYDAGELADLLARGEREPLRHIDFSRHRIREIDRLGEDAAYALGLIYVELGIHDVAEELLRHALATAPRPWSEEAFLALRDLLVDQDRYAELETVAREVSGLDARVALARALYGQDRYEELADELESLHPLVGERLPPTSATAQEAALWYAITLIELERPGWADAIRALYRDYPAAAVHSRVWVYLINRDELLDAFSADEIDLFRAKQLQSEGRTEEAAAILFGLASAPNDLLRSPWGLLDIYTAGVRSGRLSAAVEALLAAAADDAPPDLHRRALEYAGRLYRRSGAWGAAMPLLERSLALAANADDEKRLRWYLLSTRVRREPVEAAFSLATVVPTLSDPPYFGDIFFELAGLLAERERWDAVLAAYEAIDEFATPAARARYEVILARAFETGRLSAAAGRAEELRSMYLERAAAQRENLFAALVAVALLDDDGTDLLAIDETPSVSSRAALPASGTGGEGPGPAGEADAAAVPAVLLAETYLRYALLDRLFATVRGSVAVGPDLRTRAAARLAREGRIRESVLTLGSLEASGGSLTREAARLRYPLAYAAIIERRVAAEEVDRAAFYALIREESLFDPVVSSFAGAVGLAQLIPSTAADIAGRMDLEDPDLTDPADNLAIGARYFSMLTEQFGTVARALAAYNGGQGNVRRWERRSPALDEILFHEAIPFPETYNHVRKVVVSAAYYGYLYAGRAPSESVRLIFDLR
jgi:soluble lytic murein transglycosylase-like protein